VKVYVIDFSFSAIILAATFPLQMSGGANVRGGEVCRGKLRTLTQKGLVYIATAYIDICILDTIVADDLTNSIQLLAYSTIVRRFVSLLRCSKGRFVDQTREGGAAWAGLTPASL